LKNKNILHNAENLNTLFLALSAVLSIGFMGINDSISHANWKFYALIMPSVFEFHVKRTLLFLISVFSLLIAIFIFLGLSFAVQISIKYLYCLSVILFISIGVSFTVGNMLLKAFKVILAIILTLWLSTLQIYFLVLPALLAAAFMFKAKNEYTDRYYL
jgi:hypothetical protein